MTMLHAIRKGVLAGALALGLAGPAAAEAPLVAEERLFHVYRDGDHIGEHRIVVARYEDRTEVDVEIKLTVTILGVTVFRYEHQGREIWRDGRLIALDSETHDDGTDAFVRARAEGDGLRIAGSTFSGLVEGDITPTSYWRPRTVREDRLFSTQDGRIFNVAIAQGPREEVKSPGRSVPATRYVISGELELELWYDDGGDWVGTRFDGAGEPVSYELVRRTGAASLAALAAAN